MSYKVSCYGASNSRLILTRTYRALEVAQRVARTWARWGVLHCGSLHGMAPRSGYTRREYGNRVVYDEDGAGARRAVVEFPAVRASRPTHKSFADYLVAAS